MVNYIFNFILYGLAAGFLIFSFIKDRKKTKKALLKAWRSFASLIPILLGVIIIIGIILAIISPEVIAKIIGEQSGFMGVAILSVIGSILIVPGFIAFPTAALLVEQGAGYMQVAAFVASLMSVGVVTLPLEIKYFGKKLSAIRNLMAFAFSFIVAIAIGWVMGIK